MAQQIGTAHSMICHRKTKLEQVNLALEEMTSYCSETARGRKSVELETSLLT